LKPSTSRTDPTFIRLSSVQQLEARVGETIRRGYWFFGASESEYSMMFFVSR
jgi:hypothetical protein